MWDVKDFSYEFKYKLGEELYDIMHRNLEESDQAVENVLREANSLAEGVDHDLSYCISRALSEMLDNLIYELMDDHGITPDGGSETRHGPRFLTRNADHEVEWYASAFVESECGNYGFTLEIETFTLSIYQDVKQIQLILDNLYEQFVKQKALVQN